MRYLLSILGIFLLICLVSYAGYQFNRWWNYSWSYESKVQETVCEMVKPEYLKNPEQC